MLLLSVQYLRADIPLFPCLFRPIQSLWLLVFHHSVPCLIPIPSHALAASYSIQCVAASSSITISVCSYSYPCSGCFLFHPGAAAFSPSHEVAASDCIPSNAVAAYCSIPCRGCFLFRPIQRLLPVPSRAVAASYSIPYTGLLSAPPYTVTAFRSIPHSRCFLFFPIQYLLSVPSLSVHSYFIFSIHPIQRLLSFPSYCIQRCFDSIPCGAASCSISYSYLLLPITFHTVTASY